MLHSRINELSELVLQAKYTTKSAKPDAKSALNMFQFLINQVKKVEGMVYVIGNGGSAGIASHFSIDLQNALSIPSQTFYDSNSVTCYANDYGYDSIFEKPLKLQLKANDLLVAISSSGQSENILRAVAVANEKNATVVTLSGFSAENPLNQLGALNIWLDSQDYGLVETGHFFILHTLIDSLNPCRQKSTPLKKLEA